MQGIGKRTILRDTVDIAINTNITTDMRNRVK